MIPRVLLIVLLAFLTGCRNEPVKVVVVSSPQPVCPTTSIFVYEAGTRTFATLYTDSAMTIPLTNPFFPDCRDGSFSFYTTSKNLSVEEGK